MADNSQLPASGEIIRDKDRSGVKTQIVGIDLNISGVEKLMQAGQQAMADSLPVVISSDQTAIPVTGSFSATPASASSVTTEALVSVTTSSTAVLADNPTRKGGWVRNISDVDVYVSFSDTATTAKPSLLRPEASMALCGDGWLYTGEVSAIHAGSGSKSLEVVEF